MIGTGYGTTIVVESLTGATNTLDVYSTPLSSATHVLAGDTGKVAVWIKNAGSADIIVNVSAAFFDYDSGTGSQTPLVTTGTTTATIIAGNPMKVSSGPGAGLGADYTIPVGHQLKATIEIDVTSGTATDGRLEYGGPFGSEGDSIIEIPYNRTTTWSFGGACPTTTVQVPTLSGNLLLILGVLIAGIGYLLAKKRIRRSDCLTRVGPRSKVQGPRSGEPVGPDQGFAGGLDFGLNLLPRKLEPRRYFIRPEIIRLVWIDRSAISACRS